MSYNRVRGAIITLGIFTVIVALSGHNQFWTFALVVVLACTAMILLYKNLDVVMDIGHDNPRLGVFQNLSLFGFLFLGICVVVVVLKMMGILSENGEKYAAAGLISMFMLVIGNASPKIGHNKFYGLRLPWTLLDEQSWIVAHRLLGYTAFPLTFAYIALVPYVEDFSMLTFIVFVVLWIGFPSLISGLLFLRKTTGWLSAKENAKEEGTAGAIESKRRKKRPRDCMSEEGKVAGRTKTG